MIQELAYTAEPVVSFLPAIIGGVASIAGGVLARRDAAKAQNRAIKADARRIQTTVEDARLAGINPLTALNANTGPGPAFFAPQAFLGQAVATAGQMFAEAMARRTEQANEQSALRAVAANENLMRVSAFHAPETRGAPRIFDSSRKGATPDDFDYVEAFDLQTISRPHTRTAHFGDASIQAFHITTGKPVMLTPAMARYMGVGPGATIGNDEMSKAFGFEMGERFARPYQTEEKTGVGSYDSDVEALPHIYRIARKAKDWAVFQVNPEGKPGTGSRRGRGGR